jgi:hypothetical protein
MSYIIITEEEGPPCPRCYYPMQTREHRRTGQHELSKPYYYRRRFAKRSCPLASSRL